MCPHFCPAACPHSGPAVRLPLSPPRFYGDAARAMSLRGLSTGEAAGGSAGQSLRGSSADAGGQAAGFLRPYWDSSVAWIRDIGQRYSKFSEEFKEADKTVQVAVRAGTYIYIATSSAISAIVLYLDGRVDSKIDGKVGEERKEREDFERRAVRDFQDHVSKTQSSITKLHEKVLENQEKEMDHRHEVMTATKYLELHGYLVFSTDEYTALMHKVSDIEKKTVSTTKVVSADEFDALLNKVNEMEKQTASTTTNVSVDELNALLHKVDEMQKKDAFTNSQFSVNGEIASQQTTVDSPAVKAEGVSIQITPKDGFAGTVGEEQQASDGSSGMAESPKAAGVPSSQGSSGPA